MGEHPALAVALKFLFLFFLYFFFKEHPNFEVKKAKC